MTARETLRAMFEPARYPAPALDGFSTAWRYGLAGFGYLGFLAIVVGAKAFESSAPTASATASTTPIESVTSPTPGAVQTVASTSDGADVLTVQPYTIEDWPVGLLVVDGVLGLFALWAIRFRRRWPLGLYLALTTAGLVSNSLWVVMVWSFVSLCSRRDLRKIGIAIGYSVAVSMLGAAFLPWQRRSVEAFASLGPVGYAVPYLSTALMMTVMALLGMYYGVRQDRAAGVQDRAANADRDRELAVLGERSRIAREMHDVLAHRISLVSMHAGALAYRDDLTPEQTREVAHVIQENAHASLTELRSVLSTLRDGGVGQLDASGSPVAPQPTLHQLPDLLAEARSLGQRVSLHSTIDVDAVPQVTARHVFRILQECLTNARKHAPYCLVDVGLQGATGSGLEVHVSNALATTGGAVPGAGLGLIGIRERVTMLGGRLSSGVRDGRFTVDVWLPWRDVPSGAAVPSAPSPTTWTEAEPAS